MIQGILRAIVAALALALASVTSPAFAQKMTAAEEAEEERIFAELKKVIALEKEGERDIAAMRTRKLCLESKDPSVRTNFACYHFRNNYKDHRLYEDVISELCLRDSATDCMGWFFLLENEGLETTKQTRLGLLGKACQLGRAPSCGLFASSHMLGKYMEPNFTQGQAGYRRGCSLQDAEICFEYMDLLNRRIFGPFDKAEFIEAAENACPVASGYAQGTDCLKAAKAIELKVDDSNQQLVRDFLGVSCSDFLNAEACYWLAEDYTNGDTGPVNRTEAAKALAKACRVKPEEEMCS